MSDLPAQNKEAVDRRSDFVVMKFGGTSVEDAVAIRRVSELVKRQRRYRPIVVVSALAEVTDQLVSAGKSAAEGQREFAKKVLEQLRSIIYINVASDLQVGLQMLRSAIRGGIANMRINLTDVKDPDLRLRYEDQIVGWEQTLRGGGNSGTDV